VTDDPQTVDEIPWGEPPPDQIATSRPKTCNHRGTARVTKNVGTEEEPVYSVVCGRCDHVFDPEKRKQGRSSNRIAKDIERWVGKILRLTRVGQYGGQEDLGKADEWAFVQVKSGPSWFAERYYREIAALPQQAGRRRALVVAEKPGSANGGRARRALWIEILEEVPLPTVTMKWIEEDDRLKCSNCGQEYPLHRAFCVHFRG
jgi:hypothetical protein